MTAPALSDVRASHDTSPEMAWQVLAPLLSARGRMRVSRDGGRTYRTRDERTTSEKLPNQPAALLVYDHTGCAPTICLDLDSSRGGPAAVDRDTRNLARLLNRAGLRWFSDLSPNRGRHIYIPLEDPAPAYEVRTLMTNLSACTPTLDTLPMVNIHSGCLRPPGARHRTGGHQQLEQSISAAADMLHRRNSTTAWRRLQAEAAPSKTTNAPAVPPEDATDNAEQLEALNGINSPDATFTAIARTGDWPQAKYRTASEARQAVIWAAAASGWTLTDVARRLADGTWPGLASMYARYRPHHRHTAVARDWHRAITFEASRRRRTTRTHSTKTCVRTNTTSEQQTQRGLSQAADRARQSTVSQQVRVWLAAVDYLNRHWDLADRAVLHALAQAAVMTGRLEVEHGNRSLAIATGLDQSTVGRVLKKLRAQPTDRLLIDQIRDAHGIKAHTYALVIPDLLRPACETKPWRRGPIHAIRPAFRELGITTAFVYSALEQAREPLTGRELARTATLGHSSTHDALHTLASWGLAQRGPNGWKIGRASLGKVAEQLGTIDLVRTQTLKYLRERHAWWLRLGRHDLLMRAADVDTATTDDNEGHSRTAEDTTADHHWPTSPPIHPTARARPSDEQGNEASTGQPAEARRAGETRRDHEALNRLLEALDATIITATG